MFAAKPLESTPAEDSLKSLRPEPPAPPSSGTFSFHTPPSRPPEPRPIAQGGFTQLLQALNEKENQEETLAQSPEPFMPPPPPSPAAPNAGMAAGMGGFTQLLQTLSADPAARPAAQPSPMPPAASPPATSSPATYPTSGAPGEFTRVIQGDQFRALHGQNAAAGQVAPGPPVLPPQPAAAPRQPLQFPSAPAFSPAPAMPQMPVRSSSSGSSSACHAAFPTACVPVPTRAGAARTASAQQAAAISAAYSGAEYLRATGNCGDPYLCFKAPLRRGYSGFANRMISSISGFGISPGT